MHTPARPTIDLRAIDQLLELSGDEDTGLLDEVIGVFAANAPDSVRRIREALTAGQLREASRHAHTLAGSALTLGASDVVALARRIEHGALDGQYDALAGVADEIEVLIAPTIEALRDVSVNYRGPQL